MKIAINCAFYQPRGGGIAEYIFNLVNNIGKIDKENDYILYVLKDQLSFARRGLPGGLRRTGGRVPVSRIIGVSNNQ